MLDKHHKIKKIKSFGLLAAFLLSAAFAIAVIQPQIVNAANPPNPPKCQYTILESRTGTCDINNPLFPLKNGGTFLDDHCYKTEAFGSSAVWAEQDCNIPPFNTNWQSVKCNDGLVHQSANEYLGIPITHEMICKGYGGVAYSRAELEGDCKGADLGQNCGIVTLLKQIIDILSGLVGLVIVSMIIVGGIQYSSAGDDPQKVSAAKTKITNALLALLVFIFMFAFLQWVVPGGIF